MSETQVTGTVAPIDDAANYPVGTEEIDHDAYTIARIVATQMRAKGTDPRTIIAADAWKHYVQEWENGVKKLGQQRDRRWDDFVKLESPLGKRFQIAWRILNQSPTALASLVKPIHNITLPMPTEGMIAHAKERGQK